MSLHDELRQRYRELCVAIDAQAQELAALLREARQYRLSADLQCIREGGAVINLPIAAPRLTDELVENGDNAPLFERWREDFRRRGLLP